MEEVQLTSEKSFQIELSSDKNNSYSLEFNLNNYIEIKANQINNIISKTYSNKYSFEEIRETKYFLQFDTFSEVLDEIKERIDNNEIILKETENKLVLNLPLPSSKNKEIIFELNPIIKNNDDRLNELTDLIIKLNTEINNIQNENEEIINLKNDIKQLNDKYNNLEKEKIQLNKENMQLKNEIDNINNIKDKNTQLMKDNAQIIYDINYLKNGITQLKNEINILRNNNNSNNVQIENDNNQLKNKNIQLNYDINRLTNDNNQLKNENIQLNYDINKIIIDNNQLKNENIQLKNNETQIKNENEQLKKEVTELKDKLNILWTERNENKMISNLDSKIINGNEKYNESLKYWINPSKKIKAVLLYRLSDNGDNPQTFHKLCDNKGPTLTLFSLKNGYVVGIYTPLSWDSSGKWKGDMDTFIFNLNKNQKYKKLKNIDSIYCVNVCGPYTMCFGCDRFKQIKSIFHNVEEINKYYDKGSQILPTYNKKKEYELIETEVFKMIIEQ